MALTLRRLEGFDAVDTATRGLAIDTQVSGGSITIASPGASGAGNYMRAIGTSCRARWSVGAPIPVGDRIIVGQAIMFEDLNAVFMGVYESDIGEQTHLEVTAGGLIRATNNAGGTVLATGTTVLAINTWYYIEMEVVVHDTLGEVHVFVNGVEDISATGLDTRLGADGVIAIFGYLAGNAQAVRVDDIYIGSAPAADTPKTNFVSVAIGLPRITTLLPTGAGNTTGFTPSAGANWQNVDDAAPDDSTTYNGSAVATTKDTFATSDLPAAGDVYAVQMDIYATKQDAGNRSLREVYRIGGTDYTGNEVPLSPTTYAYQRTVRQVSPATAVAFTDAELNGAEIGYQVAV